MKEWKEIKDNNVRMFWKCTEPECEDPQECYLKPTFYQDNGTPLCNCDTEMTYIRTEIKEDFFRLFLESRCCIVDGTPLFPYIHEKDDDDEEYIELTYVDSEGLKFEHFLYENDLDNVVYLNEDTVTFLVNKDQKDQYKLTVEFLVTKTLDK